jgi:hypothetical protein
MMTKRVVQINRAPVLTLWGSVVAERLGYDTQSALSLGKALSGLNAQAKGRSLGIFHPKKGPEGGPPKKVGLGEEFWIELCGRGIPSKNTVDGMRAVVKDKPVDPAAVQRYLEKKFAEDLDRVKAAMRDLAESFEPEELSDRAYSLYERFRPVIPKGKRGWGAKGDLDLDLIRSLAD